MVKLNIFSFIPYWYLFFSDFSVYKFSRVQVEAYRNPWGCRWFEKSLMNIIKVLLESDKIVFIIQNAEGKTWENLVWWSS